MEVFGCNKRLCSWWKPSSYTRLLGFMLPFILVSVFVALKGFNSNNSLLSSTSSYYSWALSSVSSLTNLKDSVPPPDEGGGGFQFRPRVVGVGGGGEKEEALSVDYNFNRSVQAPAGVQVLEAEPHVDAKEESLQTTTHRSPTVVLNHTSSSAVPSSPKIIRKFNNLQILESKLQKARSAIRDAQSGNSTYDSDYIPTGPIYWNAAAFHKSYLEMEKQFKVLVYEEGEQPIFHNGPCGSIYSMEGNFIYKLETSKFRTRDPEMAHVYFLPFSVTSIVHFIYDKNSQDHWLPMKQTVRDYVDLLSAKYPYWNRSLGADHFMLSCHDWGPEISKSVPELFKNSIRALCNANTSEGFRPSKDVSIPEINLPGGRTNGLIGGPSPSKRPILVFFAGGLHGPIRPVLLDHWEDKDPDVQVHKYLPKDVSYFAMMRKSKYCICPSGYEVASPRMVEALYMGCVPVLIKDHYVPPFSDVLNWKSFSVEISVEEIPDLKKILTGISTRQYIRMQRRGVLARRHFEVNVTPKRYDVFHMTLHSIWLRRLNVRVHGVVDS